MTMTSAYPATLDALMPQARELAESIGDTPSQNRLMRELKIGKDKARTIRQRLTEDRTAPTETGPVTEADPVPVANPIEAQSPTVPAQVAEAAAAPSLVTDVVDPVPSITSPKAPEVAERALGGS